MRIRRIRVERVSYADGPGQLWSELPGILGVQIEVQKIEGFIRRCRERFCRCGRDSINILRQRGVDNRRDRAFTEVVIVQPENSGVRSKSGFVRAMAPGQVVVDEKARGASSLHPGIVEASDCGERCIGATSLQHDWKSRESLLEIARGKQAFIPRKSGVEI